MRKIDWSPVLDSVGVDSAWEAFKCRFLDVVNVMAPIRHLSKVENKAFKKCKNSQEQPDFVLNTTDRAGWMKLRGVTLLIKIIENK